MEHSITPTHIEAYISSLATMLIRYNSKERTPYSVIKTAYDYSNLIYSQYPFNYTDTCYGTDRYHYSMNLVLMSA